LANNNAVRALLTEAVLTRQPKYTWQGYSHTQPSACKWPISPHMHTNVEYGRWDKQVL